jgi:hypothetical protein
VYAPEAALARRIEVKAVKFLDQNDPNAAVRVANSNLNLGKLELNMMQSFSFTLVNRSNEELQITKLEIPCSYISIEEAYANLSPLSSLVLKGTFTAQSTLGPQLLPIVIHFSNGSSATVYVGVDIVSKTP